MFRSKLKTGILALSVSVMAFSLITFPREAVNASIRGMDMWLEIVFPTLLPFFIVTEMLIGFGVVKFVGVLLEPLMRPLFKVPGVGGFAWAMGMASGYPAGAKFTARLRQEGQLTKIEAERLAAFTNSSNPLFIFGAVSVGFFNNPQLGIIFALSHYLGNISVGLIMRFYGRNEPKQKNAKLSPSLKEAFAALHRTRVKDNRPIGKLLGDSVMSSVQTLLMIGGFIILFSVLNRILSLLHITTILSSGIDIVFEALSFPVELSIPFIAGIFEITLGSQMISQVKEATLMQQAIITSLILGFNGFSVQAQVASILAQTDIRFKPFFFARIAHGIFAALFTLILWRPIYGEGTLGEQPTNAVPVSFLNEGNTIYKITEGFNQYGAYLTISILALYVLIYARYHVFKK